MSSDPQRQSLPFEPKNSHKDKASKVPPKKAAQQETAKVSSKGKVPAALRPKQKGQTGRQAENSIPEVVSRRMIRRMAAFSGVPTVLGLAVFVGAYFLLSRHILDFPKSVVLFSTLALFGLGFFGLTYGVLSSSWEEETEGSLLGTSEFSLNFGRMVKAWKEAKQR